MTPDILFYYIVTCHLPRAPSYGGVRTWVEGSQMRGDRALARASNLLGYNEYAQQDLSTKTAHWLEPPIYWANTWHNTCDHLAFDKCRQGKGV